ncbi:hypothetical protein HRbin23_00701 [bacterium HR23]|nr:hypothetical protein HRbin23_00701 [bacterium HR23]
MVADSGWRTGGVSAEITAQVAEKAFPYLKAPPRRVALPDLPAPTSLPLEEAYYPKARHIVEAGKSICATA